MGLVGPNRLSAPSPHPCQDAARVDRRGGYGTGTYRVRSVTNAYAQ
jgi:hypothetical protein